MGVLTPTILGGATEDEAEPAEPVVVKHSLNRVRRTLSSRLKKQENTSGAQAVPDDVVLL